jgi:hypothetical protein
MKIFDQNQVVAVLSPLKARFDDCAHGEGRTCETLDQHLRCCAEICFEFVGECRKWALGVFSGEVVFDPAAEAGWQFELGQIQSHAAKIWNVGRHAEIPCWDLPGQNMLGSALWELHGLLENWVTPKLSAGPMVRVKPSLSEDQIAIVQAQLAALPPLRQPTVERA